MAGRTMNDHCADCGGPSAYGDGEQWCACCVCSARRGNVHDLADVLDLDIEQTLDLVLLRHRYNTYDARTL
jgi:hypothetical protein